jgi:hypothetical protein
LTLQYSAEVEPGENTIMRDDVVFPMGFIVEVVLETGGIGVT